MNIIIKLIANVFCFLIWLCFMILGGFTLFILKCVDKVTTTTEG